MPLALYNGTHTLVWIQWSCVNTYLYIYSEIQHTYKNSYMGAISDLADISDITHNYVFISGTHTLTLVDTHWNLIEILIFYNEWFWSIYTVNLVNTTGPRSLSFNMMRINIIPHCEIMIWTVFNTAVTLCKTSTLWCCTSCFDTKYDERYLLAVMLRNDEFTMYIKTSSSCLEETCILCRCRDEITLLVLIWC